MDDDLEFAFSFFFIHLKKGQAELIKVLCTEMITAGIILHEHTWPWEMVVADSPAVEHSCLPVGCTSSRQLVAKADSLLCLTRPSGVWWISVLCHRSFKEIIFSAFVCLLIFSLKITNNSFLCQFSHCFCCLGKNPACRLKLLLQTWLTPIEVARSISLAPVCVL